MVDMSRRYPYSKTDKSKSPKPIQFVSALGNLPLSVIQFPVGTWGFVGRVPSDLAFVSDSEELTQIAIKHGSGIARDIAKKEGKTFRTRTWVTKEGAVSAAVALGYEVDN